MFYIQKNKEKYQNRTGKFKLQFISALSFIFCLSFSMLCQWTPHCDLRVFSNDISIEGSV